MNPFQFPAHASPRAALRVALLAASFCSLHAAAAADRPIYKDPAADVDHRVDDLLARMTLPEKIAQITAIWTQKPQIFDATNNLPAKGRGR